MKHEATKGEGGSALPAGHPCCQADPPPPPAVVGVLAELSERRCSAARRMRPWVASSCHLLATSHALSLPPAPTVQPPSCLGRPRPPYRSCRSPQPLPRGRSGGSDDIQTTSRFQPRLRRAQVAKSGGKYICSPPSAPNAPLGLCSPHTPAPRLSPGQGPRTAVAAASSGASSGQAAVGEQSCRSSPAHFPAELMACAPLGTPRSASGAGQRAAREGGQT